MVFLINSQSIYINQEKLTCLEGFKLIKDDLL
jgi:hypothetical protein